LAFYRELYDRLTHVGGIESVGMTSHLPMYRFGWNSEFTIEGGTPWGANDAMAEKFWPGADPVGKRFGQGPDVSKWYSVVGVVSDVRSFGLARSTPFEFYRTIEESPFSTMTVVIRSASSDPTAIVPTARQLVASIDPALPVTHVQTMEQVVSESLGQPRLMSSLTVLFGVLAGTLAMVGVYGVMAYNVRRQRREFGIRLALGADAGRVWRLVAGRGLALAAVGVALGAVG